MTSRRFYMSKSIEKSDFVIVGGVAAGPKTAATLARRLPDASITLFQKEEYLSYATCGFPYFASGEVNSFQELLLTSYGVTRDASFFEHARGFTAVTQAEVTHINRPEKTVGVRMLQTGELSEHGYGKLVLATGATPKIPPMPVAQSEFIRPFTRPSDAIGFRKLAQTGQIENVVIVGGGFIGVELCEAVKDMWGIEVQLFEKEPQLLPYMLDPEMAAILQRSLKNDGISINTGAVVDRIDVNTEGKPEVFIQGQEPVKTDYVFLCLGVEPETTLAKDCGLNIGTSGGIVVDNSLRTSDADIYAGGDCIESIHRLTKHPVYIPMGSLANRHGRVIAENLAGGKAEFTGVVGAFVLRAFETNTGGVGLSEQAAEREGLSARAVWGSFPDKPDYNPEVRTLTLKIVYEEGSQKLLGLQAVGKGDICRRIDVFSSLLQRGAKVADILDFEHCYAPPFAEALDPLHHMAGIAQARQRGSYFVGPQELAPALNSDIVLLDVRENEEVVSEPLYEEDSKVTAQVIAIPLTELRERLSELDRNKRILIVCRRGPRSYQASLILEEAGFEKVEVLAAGLQAQH